MLPHALWLPGEFLDAHERRPPVWAAVLAGAGLGLTWGVADRVWMRLISISAEFSAGRTAFIVAVPTIFGLCVGLAFAARRWDWDRWGHYLPRGLVVVSFLPFAVDGRGPLMLTVLLVTLAVTQRVQPIVLGAFWLLVGLLFLAGGAPLITAVLLVALVITVITWKLVAPRLSNERLRWLKLWLPRLVQAVLLLLALSSFIKVSWEIVTDKPGVLAPVYVLIYLVLLYSLFLGLRVGLEPGRARGSGGVAVQPNNAMQLTAAQAVGSEIPDLSRAAATELGR